MQSRLHQTANHVFDAEFADFGDAENFRRGKAVQVDFGITGFQRAQEIFVVVDLQIRVQAALQQDPGTAEGQHFVDFLVNVFEGKDVALFVAEGAIERAERTVFCAEIGVVDVAIDLIRGDARIVLFKAQLVRLHSDADQIIGFKQSNGLLFGQCHVESPSEPSILADWTANWLWSPAAGPPLQARREEPLAFEVFIGDVGQGEALPVFLLIKVAEVAVDVFFATMKLKVEPALGVAPRNGVNEHSSAGAQQDADAFGKARRARARFRPDRALRKL